MSPAPGAVPPAGPAGCGPPAAEGSAPPRVRDGADPFAQFTKTAAPPWVVSTTGPYFAEK